MSVMQVVGLKSGMGLLVTFIQYPAAIAGLGPSGQALCPVFAIRRRIGSIVTSASLTGTGRDGMFFPADAATCARVRQPFTRQGAPS